ncbi:MAG: methyltransferase domain-containing protein [Candidatus Eisenbacteria bacterium]
MTKRRKVDKLITAVPGRWKFDGQVAENFDSHVRKSVPLYEEVQSMVVDMSEWFVAEGSTVYDIGSSTGETIALLMEKHSGKKTVRFIGIESSAAMIPRARAKCRGRNVRFVNKDVMDVPRLAGADFVYSLYTIQFLPLKHRTKLLSRIHRDLSEGGVFLVVEKIRAEAPATEDMWLELYWDFKSGRGLTDDMILQKARSLRGVLFPLTLGENVRLLEEAGFANIEVFFKWFNFAGLIALKPAAGAGRDEPGKKTRAAGSAKAGRAPRAPRKEPNPKRTRETR